MQLKYNHLYGIAIKSTMLQLHLDSHDTLNENFIRLSEFKT